ncbi:hypothetical protein KSS87_013279 [Heliosperma pusillum]|nr:hypothetical protein KSS87_013279 [Heliosperma pusillum]
MDQYPYRYPPPPISEAYPPPSPQHSPYPYQYSYTAPYPHQNPYPYQSPPAYPYPHPYPSQPNHPSPRAHVGAYSGHVPHVGAPAPTFQHSSSLQYDSSHYQYPDSGVYQSPSSTPQPPLRSHSLGSGFPSNSVGNVGTSEAITYPPLEDLVADLRVSNGRPSVPVSPSAPSVALVGNSPMRYGRSSSGADMGFPDGRASIPASPSVLSGPLVGSSPMAYASSSGELGNHSYYNRPFSRAPSWDSCFSCTDGSPSIPSSGDGMQLVPSQKGSLKVLLLHGNLDVWVYGAKNLPNMDLFHKTLGDMFSKLPGRVTNKIEGHVARKITSDPYVSIALSHAVIGRTYVIANEENPEWMQHFNVPVAQHAAEVHFLVKDSDVVGSQLIGSVSLPVEQIYLGAKVEGTFPIMNGSGKQCKPGAVLSISVQYAPISNLSIYRHGVGAGPSYEGVTGTYFPLRTGGRVTLYQDAHVPDGYLPEFNLDMGMKYVHGKCWQDISDAIRQARRLVYIVGWSIWHKVRLVRNGSNPESECSLGDLLRSKSAEGVRVLLLVWDDPTSRSILGYRTEGIMATHDEETRRFFKNSSVQVLLCPRVAGKRHSWVKKRGTTTGCPREPWHDLHCKIDGPAAYDVLTNFKDRWLKASKPHGIKKLKMSYDDSLLRIERLPEIIQIDEVSRLTEDDPESWHVQVFRSIDSNSTVGFPKNPKEATSRNLVCGKNVLIDMSIHTAYVKAIRSAQHYIYIENQYFIGSSYNWSANRDLGANNLIPMEIALKIAEKIRAHERFAAYIVIPMWPEGVPTGAATQRILFWQNRTMQMMYETIFKALVEVGLEDAYTPQDFLNFFCLGNREGTDGSPGLTGSHQPNSPQALSQKSRRFMIYVHSKGMIVDDEYVILGSANINQRSMEGTRDTEIAMGAYQSQHTWARKSAHPFGQIYGYRMSLWAEHLGLVEDCFTEPETVECVRRVRTIGEMNWKQFAAEDPREMTGHLLKYPVDVDRRGKVRPLPGCENFPDLGGSICGSFLAIQENLTI